MIFAKIKLSPSTVPDPFLFDAVMVVTVQNITINLALNVHLLMTSEF